jgi:hypothetical protein
VAKNRLGAGKPEFRLRLDFTTAGLSEIAMPAPEAAARAKTDARLADMRTAIRRAVMAEELRSANEVAMAVGKGNRQDKLALVKGMLAAGELVRLNGLFRVSGARAEAAE